MRPQILLVSTCRWVAPARLASAFWSLDCHVDAVCARRHALTSVRGLSKIYPWHPLAPLHSLEVAIATARPDFVIPCDDMATFHLHRLYDQAVLMGASHVCEVLERSLGDPGNYGVATSRSGLMRTAHELRIRVPSCASIDCRDTLWDWVNRNGLPIVMKADHTFGGRGVRVLAKVSDVDNAWQTLSSPASPIRTLKRMLVNCDMNDVLPCILRSRNAVSLQRFVTGGDANATVACLEGKVLACVTASVVRTATPRGPATVLKIIDHPEMESAAHAIVASLGLSGLIGFDFVIEQASGDAYFIEMNPRATQICHLALGPDRDLTAALQAALSGAPRQPRPPVTGKDIIALFPQEWRRDPHSEFLAAAYHDVPWEEPDLINASVETDWRFRLWERLSSKLGDASDGQFRVAHRKLSDVWKTE